MFKKIVAICITVMVLCTSLLTAIPVSAAAGTDISETFEYYGSMDGVDATELLRAFWVAGGCLSNGGQSIDDTKSAPNRGDGKSPGNYRSMRMDIKFSKGPDGTWASCRINTHEDWGCIKDSIAKYDKSLAFSFWADVEKEMKVKASIDINNVPYFKVITLKPGWKKYTLKFTDLEPATDKYGEGTGIFDVQKMTDKGTGGWKYAFFCGYKFEVFADWQEAQENTFWVDTFAIHGDTIKERTEYKVEVGDTIYPTEFDCDGSVPANFVPEKDTSSSNKNEGTSSSNKNNTTSSNKNNTTSSNKNNTTSSNKTNTTSSNKNNTTTSNNNVTTSTVVGGGTTSTIVDNNAGTTDTTVSDVTNSNGTSTDVNNNQNVGGNAENSQENSKIDLGLILTIILAASLIIGNTVAVILFIVQKKRTNIK